MLNLSESGHPIICATSALERGILKSKGGCKISTHFREDYDNVELVVRFIVSVNPAQYARSSRRHV